MCVLHQPQWAQFARRALGSSVNYPRAAQKPWLLTLIYRLEQGQSQHKIQAAEWIGARSR